MDCDVVDPIYFSPLTVHAGGGVMGTSKTSGAPMTLNSVANAAGGSNDCTVPSEIFGKYTVNVEKNLASSNVLLFLFFPTDSLDALMSGKIISPRKVGHQSSYSSPSTPTVDDVLQFDGDNGLQGSRPLPAEELKAMAIETHNCDFTNSSQLPPIKNHQATLYHHPVDGLLQQLIAKNQQLSVAAKKLETTTLTLNGKVRDANEKQEKAQSNLDQLQTHQKKMAAEKFRKVAAQQRRKVSHIGD